MLHLQITRSFSFCKHTAVPPFSRAVQLVSVIPFHYFQEHLSLTSCEQRKSLISLQCNVSDKVIKVLLFVYVYIYWMLNKNET